MAGIIKEKYPETKLTFIARSYTEPVVALSQHIDEFVNWDKFENISVAEQAKKLKSLHADWIIHLFPNKHIARAAKKACIPNRVGSSHRIYHWLTCNKQVSFSRKNSDLHEAQLNCKLLKHFSIPVPSIDNIWKYYGFSVKPAVKSGIQELIDPMKINIVLHPKSKGSSRDWGLENFQALIDILSKERYKIFISGTSQETESMKSLLEKNVDVVTDITGKFSLAEFITFLSLVDGIVAASTGPLHIAASLGKHAIGIYPPIRPMHPGRWAPIGKNVRVLVKDIVCNDCRQNGDCHCIKEISALEVKKEVDKINKAV
jgi:ADP-heptose:LPS heptosyltransferase